MIPQMVQVKRYEELKELQQRVGKAQECQQKHTKQLDEFQDIDAQLSGQEFNALQETQEGKKEIAEKMVEHLVTHDLTMT